MKPINRHIHIVLASNSPRRRYLLEKTGMEFEIIPSRIHESDFDESDPKKRVKKLAMAKATEVSHRYADSWVIGADTIVLVNNTVLEKPVSTSDARRMLSMLSGNIHIVLTGYAIVNKNNSHLFSDVVSTKVIFKTLTPDEIEWYINTTEPYDKAGGYAIQGLGSFMIKAINGSYSNVVGLPICEVIEHLYQEGVIIRQTIMPEDKITLGSGRLS